MEYRYWWRLKVKIIYVLLVKKVTIERCIGQKREMEIAIASLLIKGSEDSD